MAGRMQRRQQLLAAVQKEWDARQRTASNHGLFVVGAIPGLLKWFGLVDSAEIRPGCPKKSSKEKEMVEGHLILAPTLPR